MCGVDGVLGAVFAGEFGLLGRIVLLRGEFLVVSCGDCFKL